MKIGPIGVQLGDDRIKIAQLASTGDKIQVVEMISVPTPSGSIIGGYVKVPRVAGDVIGKAIAESKFQGRKAIIAHPTEILQVQIMSLTESQNLDNTIASRLAQMAFEHPEELTFDYKIIARDEGKVKAIVAITNKRHIARMSEMAVEARLTLAGTDLEMLSIFRLVTACYKISTNPILLALSEGTTLKLALFVQKVLAQVKTTELTSSLRADPKTAAIEIGRFLEEYRRGNFLTESPTIFIAGLSESDFSTEKIIWETVDLPTTSIRWCEAFTLSHTYTNFSELVMRFGAFSCALGLSLADLPLPQNYRTPIIVDVRQPGFTPELLRFEV